MDRNLRTQRDELTEGLERQDREIKEGLERQDRELNTHIETQKRDLAEYATDYLASTFEKFTRGAGETIARLERELAELAPTRAGSIVDFDNLHLAEAVRGNEEQLRAKQIRYAEYFKGQENVLDAGCGRGEFLELLRERGIKAYGIDTDPQMIAHCQEKGLDARRDDILDHLAGLPDDVLGGMIAIQVIEHLDFASLFQMIRLASRKIRPDGVLILETVNPSCLTVFSGAFYADPTHHKPVHMEAARQMLQMTGFDRVEIDMLHPIPEDQKLKPLEVEDSADPVTRRLVERLNFNIERINTVLYGFADYAIVGRRKSEQSDAA